MKPSLSGTAWTRLLFGFLAAAFAVNALAYAATTAGWTLVSDNWYFVDRIVYPYAHGNLHPQDLLVKRGAMDHAQPLRRLLLLANYEWFDLDFRIEALFATLAGIASFCLLAIGIRRELQAGGRVAGIFLVAIAAVYFSLSAPMVFTWSLLTLGFTSHFFLFLWLLAAWAVLDVPSPGRTAALVVSTFLFGLVADDTALVATIAVVLAAALFGWRDRTRRGAAFLQVAACIIGIGLYLAFYRVAAPVAVDAGAAAAHGSRLEGLASQAAQAWQWILIPLSSSLVHRATLRAWFGDAGAAASIVLGLAFVLAHLWFWKKALDGERNRTAFIAVSVMFLFYGLVAGILLGRVSEFGTSYLWQPRYGFIYRWHILALLMMLVAQWPAMRAKGRVARGSRGLALASAACLIALQLPLAAYAWNLARFTRNADAEAARQLLEMGNNAGMQPPAKCAAQLVVCKFEDARRQRIVGFLERQHLNAFSPGVRARNDYPDD